MVKPNVTPEDVLDFWISAGPKKWWKKDAAFDDEITTKFSSTLQSAKSGELNNWLETPDNTLALIVLLDQFSRNMFRNDARAFAQDKQCLEIVHQAMAAETDRKMRGDIGVFAYMPLMHSENISDQKLCVQEMTRLNLEGNIKFAIIHLEIIEKFGRFPHRNAVLGRSTTPEEQAFLDDGGFSG